MACIPQVLGLLQQASSITRLLSSNTRMHVSFVVWTPQNIHVTRVDRHAGWGRIVVEKLTTFYYNHLQRREDVPPEYAKPDDEGIDMSQDHVPDWNTVMDAHDIGNILHPVGAPAMSLRNYIQQAMSIHLARWIHKMLSESKQGITWEAAVDVYWEEALEHLCEECCRKLFKRDWMHTALPAYQRDMHALVEYIMDEELHWETALLCDWEFARRVRNAILTMEYNLHVKDAPCTCSWYVSIFRNSL